MEHTLANAEAIGDEYTVASVAEALGEAYTQLGDFERAERYLNTALEYYRRNAMRPYLARVLQPLVNWYEQQGRGAEAEQARTEAHRLMKELPLPLVRPLNSLPLAPDEPQPAGPADNH
jgi:tetratricopeptide (TPR) repeat protein